MKFDDCHEMKQTRLKKNYRFMYVMKVKLMENGKRKQILKAF